MAPSQVRWSERGGEDSAKADDRTFRKKKKLPAWVTVPASESAGTSAGAQHGPKKKSSQAHGSNRKKATSQAAPRPSPAPGQPSTSVQPPAEVVSTGTSAQTHPVQGLQQTSPPLLLTPENLENIPIDVLKQIEASLNQAIEAEMGDGEADDEHDDSLPQAVQSPLKRKRRGGAAKIKDPRKTRLTYQVHSFAHELFGLEDDSSLLPGLPDFPDGPPPTSIEDFRYVWTKPRTHHYNQGAAKVFAQAMIQLEDSEWGEDDRKEICKVFLTYADRTLRERYKKERAGGGLTRDDHSRRRNDSARARRRRLFYTRRTVLVQVKRLNNYLEYLDALGIGGMSSDDEDENSNDGKQYIISSKDWRASEVTQFLRKIDELAKELKLEKRGQDIRKRVERPSRKSLSAPVSGLPANAYRPGWLGTQPEWLKEFWEVQLDQEWDLTLPDWVDGVLSRDTDEEQSESHHSDGHGDQQME